MDEVARFQGPAPASQENTHVSEISQARDACEHFYVSMHEPGHVIFWVKICHLCGRPDWDDLDQQIIALKRSEMESQFPGEVPFVIQGLTNISNVQAALDKLNPKEIKKPVKYVESDRSPVDHQGRALDLVYAYVKSRLEKTDTHVDFGPSDVYVVWFSKTLGNWKALLSTTLPDGMYYEVTHDGVACYDYIDAYKKFENVGVPEGVDPLTFLS